MKRDLMEVAEEWGMRARDRGEWRQLLKTVLNRD